MFDKKRDGFADAEFVSSGINEKVDKVLEEEIKKMLFDMGYIIDEEGNIISPKNFIRDGILGFVVGDALGVPVEFASRDILKKYPVKEMQGYGRYDVPKGTWSDDSSMMLATIDSIIYSKKIDYHDIMSRFSSWMVNAKYTATDELFDIGITTRNAILKFNHGVEPLQCGSGNYYDNGNGSLMRMLPIAYYLVFSNLDDLHEVEIINKVSALTHSHEISCLGCKIYCDYVKQLINGVDKKEAIDNLKNNDYSKYYSYSSVNLYRRILMDNLDNLKLNEVNSSGYVVDSLEAALWCTLNSNSYEEALLKAVNLGNDTDTIGALTGSFNGIIYGKDNIPSNWLDKIRKKGYIDNLIVAFIETLNVINNGLDISINNVK